MRRLVAGLGLVVLVGLWNGPAAASPKPQTTGDKEATSLRLINDARARHAVVAVRSHPDLTSIARAHAMRMREAGQIFHSEGAGSRLDVMGIEWLAAGENVGTGNRVVAVHNAFMDSPAHAANILGDYNAAGVGVAENDQGKLFEAQVFAKLPAPTPSPKLVREPRPAYVTVHTPDPTPSAQEGVYEPNRVNVDLTPAETVVSAEQASSGSVVKLRDSLGLAVALGLLGFSLIPPRGNRTRRGR